MTPKNRNTTKPPKSKPIKGAHNYCARCGGELPKYPALSRRDNHTRICSDCGLLEALEDAGMSIRYP
jgi:hypothetical protein